MALPMNSGAEAVETALKAARKWGYTVKGIPADQAEIIVASNNFHGRTIAIVGFSSEQQYRPGFGPFTPGFKHVPYGDAEALRAAITPDTCAFLVEPIQGEAGILIPPDGYLEAVAAICRENNVLLMLDEIQSGLGRTGKLFAYQHESVTPDVVIIGKALSGGFYPVSAVLSRRAVLGVFTPGDHGSTFGGNPLACAIARAALQVIIDEDLSARSAELGDYALGSPAAAQEPTHRRGPRQRPLARHRAQRPRPPLLRGPQRSRRPLQRDPRHRHPPRPTPDHRRGRPHLGTRPNRSRPPIPLNLKSLSF